jgi:hypothetical protein
MGCNCKNSNNFEYTEKTTNKTIFETILKYSFKSLAFLISLVLLPVIMIAIVWFLFDIIVLNKNVDLGRIVKIVAKNTSRFNEDYEKESEEDDDNFEEINEEDYIALNVEDITHKYK